MLSQLFGRMGEVFRPASFTVLSQGYSPQRFIRDLFAGASVGVVALPLAMAFAIASGASPERGLFTAIVAGLIISALGGSRFQIGGPTGAFVVIVLGIIQKHGYHGLVVATFMAGIILFIMGLCKMGRLIKYIPYPVTTGFTTGIAVMIFSTQVKDIFGLPLESVPAAFHAKWGAYLSSMPSLDISTTGIAAFSLAVMLVIRRFFPKVPCHFVGVLAASCIVFATGVPVETIGTRFGGIPDTLPVFSMPENLLGTAVNVIPEAITIALLAGIESLLSAVVADGISGDRHDSSTELMAQGVANVASSVFGGIPATGAIARTATNIRAGAYSPLAGIIHALVLVAFILFLAPLASYIPLASLGAVLAIVSWDMSQARRFKRLLKAPKSDAAVMLVTFALTVMVDLTVAVQVGIVLAALLFMRRMSEMTGISQSSLLWREGPQKGRDLINDLLHPEHVELYEINGPFFFGITDRFHDVLHFMRRPPKVFILRMRHVPSVDATAVDALESFLEACSDEGTTVVLSGVSDKVYATLARYGTIDHIGEENVCDCIGKAIERANAITGAHPDCQSSENNCSHGGIAVTGGASA